MTYSAGVVLEARNAWPSYFRIGEIEADLWQHGWKGHFDYLWWLPEVGTKKQSVAFIRFENVTDIKLLKDKYIKGDIRVAKEQDLSQCVTLLRQIYRKYDDALPFMPRFYNPWGERMPLKSLNANETSVGTMVPLDPMFAGYLPKNDFRNEDKLRGSENVSRSWQKGGNMLLHHDPWAKNRENSGAMFHSGKGGGMYYGSRGSGYNDGRGFGSRRYGDKGSGMGRYFDGKGSGMYDIKGNRRVPTYEGDIGSIAPFFRGKGVKKETFLGKIDLTQTVLQDDWAVGARKHQSDRVLREERHRQSDIDAIEESLRRLETRDSDSTSARWRDEPLRGPRRDERRNDLHLPHADDRSMVPLDKRRSELGPRHVHEVEESPKPDRVFEDTLSTHSFKGKDRAAEVFSSYARRSGAPARWSYLRQVGDDPRAGYGRYEREHARLVEEQAPDRDREECQTDKENEPPCYQANTKSAAQDKETLKKLRQTYFRLARVVMDHPIYRLPDIQKGSSGCVEKGEEVEVVQICGEWANVIFPSSGNKAWVLENVLEVLKCPSCSYFQTTVCPGYCCKSCQQTPGSHGPQCVHYEVSL